MEKAEKIIEMKEVMVDGTSEWVEEESVPAENCWGCWPSETCWGCNTYLGD